MYRNLEGSNFIWRGQSDPLVEYNGHTYNYWELEDTLWDLYKEDCNECNQEISDEGFEEWCKTQDLKSFMEEFFEC